MARFAPVILIAVALAACSGKEGAPGPAGATGPTGPAGPPASTSTVSGTALVLGAGGVAGTSVQLVGTSLGATTVAGGDFEITSVPDGIYALHLANGPHEETVPSVIALPGGHGFVVDASLYPLDTIELQRAHRVVSSLGSVRVVVTSPDSRWAVACEDLESVPERAFLLDITSGESTDLAGGCWGPVLFTPDSNALVFEADGIRRVPTAGGPPVLLHGGYISALSPDGWRIAATTPDPGGSTVTAISLADLTTHVLATGVQTQRQEFSPDGGALLYATSENGAIALYVAPATGGTALFLVDGVSSASSARFTPDGAAVAFGNLAGEIRTVPVSGGGTTLVASQGGGCFVVSPDGTRVVFGGAGYPATLSSVPIDGGTPVVLDSTAYSSCPPALVPGGARVIYASATDPRFRVADITGASPPVPLPTTYWPALNHAGTHAAYQRSPDGALELARLSDGAAVWSVPGPGWEPRFSPDDATLARCGGTLDAIAVASGVVTPLLSQGYPAYYCYGSFWWTSDGTLLGTVVSPPPPDGYRGGLYVTHLP